MNKKELWLRLSGYQFDHIVLPKFQDRIVAVFGGDDPSTHAFVAKISKKLGWDSKFTMRALREYKKFVYLGVVAGFPVTPPKLLDQVWHEHLLFTKAYREFCSDILERPFDHNPELLPSDEQTEVYQAQYQATLDLYQTEFGYEAPVAVWGTPKFEAVYRKPEPQLTAGDFSPSYSAYHDYSGDPPLVLWSDLDLAGTFDSDPGSDSGGGGSSDGGGCSSGCGGGD